MIQHAISARVATYTMLHNMNVADHVHDRNCSARYKADFIAGNDYNNEDKEETVRFDNSHDKSQKFTKIASP